MKRLALFTAFALWATPAFGQTASVSQTGDNQTADVTQTGSSSNEAYVTQLTDNSGPQFSTVLQNGIGNLARVSMSQTGGGNNTPANRAFLQQVGNRNDMRQTVIAPGFNSGQSVSAQQRGDLNVGRQTIDGSYTNSLTLEQRGDRNNSVQWTDGPYNFGEVYQTGNRNDARQTLDGRNAGYSAARALVDQRGDQNDAVQLVQGGASSFQDNAVVTQTGNNNMARQTSMGGASGQNNSVEIDQNGNANQAWQTADGNGFDIRVRQDGNSNWARTNSVGDANYLNARMSDGAYLRATQTGNMNNLFGTGGAGTEARILNGSSLIMTQTGDMNSSFVNMVTGGSATISQIGSMNSATVIQN